MRKGSNKYCFKIQKEWIHPIDVPTYCVVGRKHRDVYLGNRIKCNKDICKKCSSFQKDKKQCGLQDYLESQYKIIPKECEFLMEHEILNEKS